MLHATTGTFGLIGLLEREECTFVNDDDGPSS